jgi:hypothetical protein
MNELPDYIALKVQKIYILNEAEKSALWGDGTWVREPDFVFYRHLGLKCFLKRDLTMGTWDGYCEVPSTHPWEQLRGVDLPCTVHGGVRCFDHNPYIMLKNRFIGFHCAHFGDIIPSSNVEIKDHLENLKKGIPKIKISKFPATYKTFSFCMSECIKMAQQVHEAGNKKDE